MSSIMRARSAPAGRGEEWEIIGGSSLELKVAGPSMLGIGCPDRHAFLFIRSLPPPKTHRPRRAPPPARAGSFCGANRQGAGADLSFRLTTGSRLPGKGGTSARLRAFAIRPV